MDGLRPWREVLAVWVVVAFVLSIIGFLFYRYWGLPLRPFADDEIGILVAEVPDQTNREQQTAYQTAIIRRVQTNEQLRERVKVKLIERPLRPDADDQQAEAVNIGRRLGAAFVPRPFVVEGSQQPWLTVVNPQEVFQPLTSLGEFPSTELATPDKLPLPENLTQLAEVIFALSLNERHDYKDAAQVLGNVLVSGGLLKAATSQAALHRLYGDDLHLSASNTEAVAEYKEALRLNPGDAATHNNLGVALNEEGKHDDAIAEYNKALQFVPDFATPHSNLCAALNEESKHDDAIAECKEAIRLDPNSAAPRNNLGVALDDKGKHDDAIAEYNKAIQLKPDFAEAHNNLGVALNDEGKHDDAIAEFEKAIKYQTQLCRGARQPRCCVQRGGPVRRRHHSMQASPPVETRLCSGA
jgi:Flp pilus assembly protein TadD